MEKDDYHLEFVFIFHIFWENHTWAIFQELKFKIMKMG